MLLFLQQAFWLVYEISIYVCTHTSFLSPVYIMHCIDKNTTMNHFPLQKIIYIKYIICGAIKVRKFSSDAIDFFYNFYAKRSPIFIDAESIKRRMKQRKKIEDYTNTSG